MFRSLGQFAYKWRYFIIAVWIGLAVACIPFALQASDNLTPGGFSNNDFESVQASETLEDQLGISQLSIELILSHETLHANDAEFRQAVDGVIAEFTQHEEVIGVQDYALNPARVSEDGHTVYVSVGVLSDLEQAVAFAEAVTPDLDAGPLDLVVTGGVVLYRDLSVASERDLRRGEIVTFALVAVVLILILRTLPAVVLPAVVGGVVTACSLAAIYVVSQFVGISLFALNVTTLLALGLAIDYSLLQIFRYREELAKGSTNREAVATSMRFTGRAILFSSLTTLSGLSALAFFNLPVLQSLALGSLITILITMVCTLTILPALLGVVGHRLNRVPLRPQIRTSRNFWTPAVNIVTKYPLIVVTVVTVLLVVTALPATRLQLGGVDANVLPDDFESKRGYDLLLMDFDLSEGTFIPIAYTFAGDPLAPDSIDTLYGYGQSLVATENADQVSSYVNLNDQFTAGDYQRLYEVPEAVIDIQAGRLIRDTLAPGIALFVAESELQPTDTRARQLVEDIRAIEPPDGAQVLTGGQASFLEDLVGELLDKSIWVILVMVAVIYVVLLVLFRSLLLPLKAVLLNFLSIMASFGVLVLVFQDGNLSNLLGFEANGSITATTPVVMFGLLFGVSMDYEIFLLSRITEYRNSGLSTHKSIIAGLQKSAIVITGSALVLIVVGLGFLTADVSIVKAFGVGLATAIFVDATLIRIVVTPAVMSMAGRWNWYCPKWLDRIIPGGTPHAS